MFAEGDHGVTHSSPNSQPACIIGSFGIATTLQMLLAKYSGATALSISSKSRRGEPAMASRTVTSALLTLAALPAWCAAPAQTNSTQPNPTLHVYSRETIVDVLVTDANGQPVRGLTQSDFTVADQSSPPH
jgi:hypothetical protein